MSGRRWAGNRWQRQSFFAPDHQFAGASGGEIEGEIPRAGVATRL
jgi:hypothetical protein